MCTGNPGTGRFKPVAQHQTDAAGSSKPGRRRQFHGKLHEDDEQYDASGICILLSVTSDRSWYLLDRRCGIQRYPAGCCHKHMEKMDMDALIRKNVGENECQT